MGTAAKLSIRLLMLCIAEFELTSDISQAMLPGQSVIQSPLLRFLGILHPSAYRHRRGIL
jgi:hypothetical protein